MELPDNDPTINGMRARYKPVTVKVRCTDAIHKIAWDGDRLHTLNHNRDELAFVRALGNPPPLGCLAVLDRLAMEDGSTIGRGPVPARLWSSYQAYYRLKVLELSYTHIGVIRPLMELIPCMMEPVLDPCRGLIGARIRAHGPYRFDREIWAQQCGGPWTINWETIRTMTRAIGTRKAHLADAVQDGIRRYRCAACDVLVSEVVPLPAGTYHETTPEHHAAAMARVKAVLEEHLLRQPAVASQAGGPGHDPDSTHPTGRPAIQQAYPPPAGEPSEPRQPDSPCSQAGTS